MVAITTRYYDASVAYVDLERYQWLARLKKTTTQLLAFKYMYMVRFGDIQLDLVIFGEIWWDMVRYG